MPVRTLYSSDCAKEFKIPAKKVPGVFSKLEKAIKNEEIRTDTQTSLVTKSQETGQESYVMQGLGSVDLASLDGNGLIIQLPAARVNKRTGKIDYYALENRDYASMQLAEGVLRVTIMRQEMLTFCPAAIDAVLEKYRI